LYMTWRYGWTVSALLSCFAYSASSILTSAPHGVDLAFEGRLLLTVYCVLCNVTGTDVSQRRF
jgi:hypothetical protein